MLSEKLNLAQGIFLRESPRKSTRDAFGECLLELGKEHPEVIVLSNDLTESVRANAFEDQFPNRFFQIGVAEQNMTSIAAGLAMNGKIAFMTSTAIFSPSRNWDQIRMSICMNNANVKIIGSHQGFSNGPDGGVAQPFEDIALLKVLPNMKIISPIDAEQTKRAVEYAIKTEGPVYIRTSKEPSVEITSATTPFEEGRPLKLWDGRDITLVSHGPITFEVLLAARELLARYKINAEVLSYGFIKPLDREALLEFAAKTKRVLVVEEHQISGGLGSTICEVLSEFLPTKVVRMGMEDMFSQSGSYVELLDKYKLSSHHIVERVKEFLK